MKNRRLLLLTLLIACIAVAALGALTRDAAPARARAERAALALSGSKAPARGCACPDRKEAGQAKARRPNERNEPLQEDPNGPVVLGTVVDERTRRPLAGALVYPYGRGLTRVRAVRVGEDGTFRLPKIPKGAEGLKITRRGYLAASVGLAPRVDAALRRAEGVVGIVEGPDGSPVAGATVNYGRRTLLGRTAVGADQDGEFRVEGLPPGKKLMLTATHPEFGDSIAVEAEAGSRGYVTLRLSPATVLRGSVVDATGNPVKGACVAADGKQATTGEDGAFEFKNLPHGPVTVSVFHDGLEQDASWSHTGRGRVEMGEIRLPDGRRIAGTVVDEQGRPVPNATVWVRPGRSTRSSTTGWSSLQRPLVTDADGRFEASRLQPGRYQVTVDLGRRRATATAETDGRWLKITLS